MAFTERPINEERRGAAPREPLYRRKELHLVVGILVAALTVAFASQRATDGARAQLDARLLQAGAGADVGIVDVESVQLSAVRSIAFTEGVARDLAAHDGPALNALVAPLQANSTVPMVDMVGPDGRVLLSVRAKGAPKPVRSYKGNSALAWAVAHAHGPRGGRLSEVVIFPWGATLLTVSPIASGNTVVGAVFAMTPLASVLGRLSQEVGADLTAYDADGLPVATTAGFAPKPLSSSEARSLMAGAAVTTRYVSGNNREELGRLIVDHAADAVLGVSLPDNSGDAGRTVAIYALIGLLCTVLILATYWARVTNARRAG